jgi:hypothetical protein
MAEVGIGRFRKRQKLIPQSPWKVIKELGQEPWDPNL